MRYLITGGMGFIGSNYIRGLLKNGHTVVNLDNLSIGSNTKNLDNTSRKQYKFVNGSVTNENLVSVLLSDADVIVNFAAETHVDRSITDASPFINTNINGVVTLLEAIRKADTGIKLIQISTDEVYGDIAFGMVDENASLRPSNPYAAAKAAADMFISAYVRTYGVDARITRSANNYGPRQYQEKLIPKVIMLCMDPVGVVPIYGDGMGVREWIHVDDHCSAIDMVIRKGKAGEVYNVSSNESFTILDVVGRIFDLTGKGDDFPRRTKFVDTRPGHDLRYSVSAAKLKWLGWSPARVFDEAFEETIKWYLDNEEVWKTWV